MLAVQIAAICPSGGSGRCAPGVALRGIQVPKLTQEQVAERTVALRKRYEGTGKLHGIIKWRREHFHNLRPADPLLPDIWAHAVEQTTLLSDTHDDMKARLLENRWVPQVFPAKDTATGKAAAEVAEQACVFLFDQHQRRTGLDIQAEIIDCMGIDGPGYLHWRVDGYEEIEEYAAESEDKKDGYTPKDYGKPAGRTKALKYREEDATAQDRIMRAKAESGGPVYLEVITGEKVYVTQDKSAVSQFKEVLVVREVGLGATYEETDGWTAVDWWEHVSGDDAERDSPVGNEQGARTMDAPSAGDWGETVTLEQFWTRDCVYETLKGSAVRSSTSSVEGEAFRAIPHWYGMPPFSKAVGKPIKSDAPEYAELPYLDSMYKRKPQLDRTLSLRNALAESGAVPIYFIQRKDGTYGRPLTDETGNPIGLAEDSAHATVLEEGETIVRFGGDGVSGSYEKMVEQQKQEMLDAAPSTGRADFGVSTKPFAALQQTRQENRVPKMLLENVRLCLEPMLNNVMKCFADAEHGPGPIPFFPMTAGDAPTTDKVMVRQPEDWVGLWGGVRIEAIDSTERIANIAHLQELVNDPIIQYPRVDFIENALGLPNPEQEDIRWDVLAYEKESIRPGIIRAEAAKWAGPQYVLMADGGLANMAGQAQKITQVAQAVGGRPIRTQQPTQQASTQPAEPTDATMGTMPATMNTPPVQGIQ